MTRLLPLLVVGLLLAACAEEPPAPEGLYTFPHEAGFYDGPAHGAPWLASPSGCIDCHQRGLGGPYAEPCTECHVLYPHAEDYREATVHGPDGLDGGLACFDCHGTGERRPVDVDESACRDCHRQYPHRATYARPEIHGVPVLDDGLEPCAGCHGEDGGGTDTVDACFDCHELYPHPEGYGEGEAHATDGNGENQHQCATSCHGPDLSGGSSGVTCAECHEVYPHQRDYSGLPHREDLAAVGEEECLDCHVEGAGHPAPFTCVTTCHGGGQ